MSNRISIESIHGMQCASESSCVVCGAKYRMGDFVAAIDHAIGKKYLFGITSCRCGRVLNKVELRRKLPDIVYKKVFAE